MKRIYLYIVIIIGIVGYIDMVKAIEIYAHRGFTGFFPETTMWGYEESLKLGVDNLDVDVALTKDNIVVGSHDPYLNKNLTRDADGNWLRNNQIKIRELTFEELKNYDIGKLNPKSLYAKKFPMQASRDKEKIPSLEEIIKLLKSSNKQNSKIQIEIKTEPGRDSDGYVREFVDHILATLKNNKFIERAELQSFDWRALLYAKHKESKIKTSFITEQAITFDIFKNTEWTAGHSIQSYDNSIIKMLSALGADTWCPYYKNVTKDLVEQAHKNNIRVVPWTADTEKEMIDLIKAGVDGIITNRSDKLRRVMADFNMSLPTPVNIIK